jgi:hypothetical protein
MFRFPHLQRLALWVYALDEQTASALAGDLVRIGLCSCAPACWATSPL